LKVDFKERRGIMRNCFLVFWVMVFFLVVGCATPEPQVKVIEKPVYVEKHKRVDVNTVISQLSNQISSTMLEQNKRKVAVMNFPLITGGMSELGLYISDKLTNSLFQYRDKFEVVERTRLESALKEMELGLTGIIDDKTVQSIGKILGADAIVIGTITDLGNEVDINVRMLGTEKANVLAVASSFLEKDEVIARLIGNIKIIEPTLVKPPHPKTEGTTPPPSVKPRSLPKVELNDFTFEPKECKWSGQRIICVITVINNAQKTRRLTILAMYGKSILVDDLGDQYNSEGVTFGGQGNLEGATASDQDIPPNLPMNIMLSYRDINPNAKYGSVVLDCYDYRDNFKAVLRNIPLTK
jgi:curli biogenesis system outer membrane secretion channel CsgG